MEALHPIVSLASGLLLSYVTYRIGFSRGWAYCYRSNIHSLTREAREAAARENSDNSTKIKELENTMALNKTDLEAKITTIAAGGKVDPAALTAAVQAEVAAQTATINNQLLTLQNSLRDDEGVEQSLVTRATDLEGVLTDVINKLAAGDTAGAQAAATAAVPTANTGSSGSGAAGAATGTPTGTPQPTQAPGTAGTPSPTVAPGSSGSGAAGAQS